MSSKIIRMEEGIGARFKEVRKSADLNQREFGKRLGISLPTVTRIERQDRVPDVELAMRLCSEFGCDLTWLILGEGTREGRPDVAGGNLLLLEKLPVDLNSILDDDVSGRFVIPGAPDGGIVVNCLDDAMAPFIRKGDLAIVTPGECAGGDIVLLRDRWGEMRIRRKRIVDGRPVFLAEDRDFPRLEDEEGVNCVGTVIKIIRDL